MAEAQPNYRAVVTSEWIRGGCVLYTIVKRLEPKPDDHVTPYAEKWLKESFREKRIVGLPHPSGFYQPWEPGINIRLLCLAEAFVDHRHWLMNGKRRGYYDLPRPTVSTSEPDLEEKLAEFLERSGFKRLRKYGKTYFVLPTINRCRVTRKQIEASRAYA